MKVILAFLLVIIFANGFSQQPYTRTLKLMGSRFDITIVAHDSLEANGYIDLAVAEIQRIEKLISSWDLNSQTSEVNRNAGLKPTKVDQELFNLVQRAIAISKLTEGAFDISYASMDRIWKFDGSMKKVPNEDEITKSVIKVGYENIILDEKNSTVFLKLPGMKIGFGAIGKGYAADKAKALLMEKGAVSGIINASGDMNSWGKKPDGSDWKVVITNPFNNDKAFALIPLEEGAVVTSGDYERYVEFNGIRYAHIINPKTGYPTTGIISATVFGSSAELCDALATAVFVMGIEVGLDLINQLPDIECIIVDEKGKLHTSENISIEKF